MKILFTPILILLCFFQVFPQETDKKVLRGKVVDSIGLPVENARIQIVSGSGVKVLCQNEPEGKFACDVNSNEKFTILVEAQDFSILRQTFAKAQDFPQNAIFTLSPAPLSETVQVTANRTETRIGETPASVVTLSSTELETTAAPTIDDALRQVAGFSLFRRTGSRHANPTAQGVSLRGVGASGASRSLVLFDGVPLNDSFGGWVQWNRVPPISVERIEVLRGGASSLYGDSSLSGTINILPKRIEKNMRFPAKFTAERKILFPARRFSASGKTVDGEFYRRDFSNQRLYFD